MKHLSKILFLCWVLLISSLKTIAQNYPVQCTPIVTPPYSLSWTDYATSTEKFKVYLLLKDLEKPSVEVTVRIRLKGLGVVLENIPDFISTKPIVLQPGIPQILSGAQLSDNFSADNLVAQGISIEDLYQGTNLPAGFYQWEVTAYLPDQRQVSNTGVTLMTVFRAQPPTITYPANNAILPNTGFQSINFTWVSNSYYSVNTAQGTLYRLRLYEIPEEDEDTDPNVVVNAGILPVFMTEVLATNYLYSSSDPVLTPGKRYALQVQAMDVNGYDQFENNGFSQVVAFTYGTQGQLATQRCLRPQQVSLEPVGDVGVVVSWTNPNVEVLDYTLSYRKTTDDQWIEKQTSELSYTLLQLPASSYEFKVLTRCSYVSKSSYSEPQGYIIAPEPIDSTIQISPPSNTIDDDTNYTSETYTVSDSNPSQQYPPAVYQAETLSSTTIDILNKPIRIVYETLSLPESLKKNLPSGGTLPQLSSNATVEELKTALNTSKIDCASYLAGYTCGQHDAPSVPSGDIIQVKTGDEIAINSIAFEVVDLDGSGNGKGIVKVPMFNNAKLGVEFKNIKVAKGGCVVAGQAELSHIDVALLSEEQRKKLAEIYAAYNLALTVADSLAPEISETINSLSDLYKKIAEKTQAILDRVNSGMKISSTEQKKLEVMKKSAKDIVDKQVMYFTERFGKNGSEEIVNLINASSQSCICQQYIAPSTPSKGPNAELEECFFYSEDCTKCLQEDIKKQQEMVTLSKAMEDKLNAIKGQKMECGCGWNSIKLIWQSVGDNGDCEEIVKVMNKFKEDLQTSGTATVNIQYMPFDANKPLGQISIGDICIDNFSLELLPHDVSGVQVYSSKKDQYDDLAVKISGNSLIFNDYQSPTTKTLTLKTDNNDQTTLVEKWLFEKAKGGDVSITTQAKFPITGVQLKEIFTKTEQSRCDEVAMLINKYSNKYGIDNAEKMSHFIGQIGAETNLSQLKELTYTAKNIENSRFATTTRKYKGKKVIKYCDLFEGYDAISTDSCPFPYCEPPLYEGTTGLIVKSKYVKNTTLFDYVYACRMGNGTIDSKDGSRFKGRGFIQLTGYNNYKTMLQEKWDKVHGVGNKDFICRSAECDKNLDMTAEDLDMAMQTALTFWADANANDFAGEVSNDAIKKVTYEINGGYNGLPERKLYTKKAYKTLKK